MHAVVVLTLVGDPMPAALGTECVMLVEIDPRIRANVDRLIAKVGETGFRRGVAEMTRWDLHDMTLDDVACLYVLARQGRVGPPEAGPRAAALHATLAPRIADDAGFTDAEGRQVSRDEWLRRRADRLAGRVSS